MGRDEVKAANYQLRKQKCQVVTRDKVSQLKESVNKGEQLHSCASSIVHRPSQSTSIFVCVCGCDFAHNTFWTATEPSQQPRQSCGSSKVQSHFGKS